MSKMEMIDPLNRHERDIGTNALNRDVDYIEICRKISRNGKPEDLYDYANTSFGRYDKGRTL